MNKKMFDFDFYEEGDVFGIPDLRQVGFENIGQIYEVDELIKTLATPYWSNLFKITKHNLEFKGGHLIACFLGTDEAFIYAVDYDDNTVKAIDGRMNCYEKKFEIEELKNG